MLTLYIPGGANKRPELCARTPWAIKIGATYFYDNFDKCGPISIILSLLDSYLRNKVEIKYSTAPEFCCRTTLWTLNAYTRFSSMVCILDDVESNLAAAGLVCSSLQTNEQTNKQETLTKTILPPALTIYSNIIIISHVIVHVNIVCCQPVYHYASPLLR